MSPAWIFAVAVSILSIALLMALFVVTRREKKAWSAKMAAIDLKYAEAIRENEARRARSRARVERIKELWWL
jgi:hypothetical protein